VLPIALGAACTSGTSEPAPTSGEARVNVLATIPVGAAEGPALQPLDLRVTATPPDAREPVTVVFGVSNRTASGELVLERRSAAERWRFRGAAAVAGDTLFRVVEDLTLRLDAPRPDLTLRLAYDGRDAALARLELFPADTTLDAGRSLVVLVRAEDPLGLIAPPTLGWRSRTATVASVDASGRVEALGSGTTWIVGRSWTGLVDSVLVRVR
jgi:hypothetical protein